jgi:integrase
MTEGFIRQRGNAWQVIVHAGRDPVTGKRRNLTGTARTKREAQALRARLLTQVDEGRRPATDATLAQLLERWLEMADLAWSTRVTYKGYIERTILPTLGHMALRRLDTATLDRFYTTLRARGGVGGKPMAPATVRQVHAILRRALDQAARWGWIPVNPAALATPPRPGSAEIRPPTPEEVSRVLETAYEVDPDFAVLLWLAATTGARRGELCALRWGEHRLGGGRTSDRAEPLPGFRPLGGERHQDPCRPPTRALRRQRRTAQGTSAPLRRAGGGVRRAALG